MGAAVGDATPFREPFTDRYGSSRTRASVPR